MKQTQNDTTKKYEVEIAFDNNSVYTNKEIVLTDKDLVRFKAFEITTINFADGSSFTYNPAKVIFLRTKLVGGGSNE